MLREDDDGVEERKSEANDFVSGAGFIDFFSVTSSGPVASPTVTGAMDSSRSSARTVACSWLGTDDVLVLELRGEPGVGTSVTDVAGVVDEPVECDWGTSLKVFVEDVEAVIG